MTEKYIEEAYEIALKMGMAGDSSQLDLFKRILWLIARSAVDESREIISTHLFELANSYSIL